MLRTCLLSAVVVLVVSTGALAGIAGITQNQAFGIESTTVAELFKGAGMVGDGKIAVISLGQTAIQSSCLWAIQDDNAIFTQRASAVGQCALLSVLQNGSAVGGQFQFLAGYSGPKAQGQELAVGLAQEVTKSQGAGTATASHGFIADSLQTLGSPSGSMSANQFTNVAQDANIGSAPCTDGMVVSGMYLTATQIQADN